MPNLRLFSFSMEKSSQVTFLLTRTVPKYSELLKTYRSKSNLLCSLKGFIKLLWSCWGSFRRLQELHKAWQHLSDPENHKASLCPVTSVEKPLPCFSLSPRSWALLTLTSSKPPARLFWQGWRKGTSPCCSSGFVLAAEDGSAGATAISL